MAMIASNGKNHYICNANIGCGLAIPSLKTAFYACFCARLSLYLQWCLKRRELTSKQPYFEL